MDKNASIRSEPGSDTQESTPPQRVLPPLPNYTLSTRCPACDSPTFKLACKVRCSKCGFMWDCSEL